MIRIRTTGTGHKGAQETMRSGPRRSAVIAAGALTLTLAAAGCGNDVPSGPMDETELETVFPTGREVPEGWDLTDEPSGSDRYGDEVDSSLPISGESADNSECTEAMAEVQEEIQDLALVADAEAGYSHGETGYAGVYAFSTDDDTDVIDSQVSAMEDCSAELLQDLGLGWDESTAEIDSTGASMDGLTMVSDSGSEGGAVVIAGESYGQNHLMVIALSQDARDEEELEDFADAVQERFQEGPSAAENEEDSD